MSNQTTNPYVGPRTFEEADSKFFFGREREAEDLLSLIIAEPLVLFYAQSGAGKSSLLNARVIPGLRKEGFSVLPVGRVGGLLPTDIGEVDNVFTCNLLLSLDQGRREASTLAKTSLPKYLKEKRSELEEAADPQDELALVLIIDQFEEIVTSNLSRWPERRSFFLQLKRAMKEDPLLWVVLTLREDFVATLDPFARLMPDRMRARFFMKRMGPAAAKAAIERPAAGHGRPFAAGVAQTLVDNLRQLHVKDQQTTHLGEYVEPVQLQVVCYQLWKNLSDRPLAEITQKDLDELGNVDVALSQFYEEAICDVLEETGGSEFAVRNWFERQLITEAETRGTVYQGATETAGMPNEIVQGLESHFLLRAEIRAGATWYELVHDRFVMPILQANQAWRMQQSPLIQAAEAWDRAERSRDLLYEGRQLKIALATVNRDTAEPIVQEFLTASEEAQSQQELESARELAEEERRRADAQARVARILRVLALALFIMVTLAIAAAASAARQRAIAEQRESEAKMQAERADNARAEAEASAIEAEQAQAFAEENELKAQIARQEAEAARAEAEANAQAAFNSAQEAEESRALAEENQRRAEANAAEAERLRQVALAQSLAALAPRIIDRSNDTELAVLLALESLRINEEFQGGLRGLIDGSLRGILSTPNFNTTLEAHDSRVVSVAFTPDHQMMASADERGVVRLWDLSGPSATSFVLTETPAGASSLRFSLDGQQVAYVDGDFDVIIWNLSTSEPSPTVLGEHATTVRHFAFGPGDQIMTTVTTDNVIRQWDLSASPPAIVNQLQRGGSSRTVGLSQGGETLVTASDDGTVNLWDLTIEAAPLKLFLIGHTEPVNAVAFTPDGDTLASADESGQIRIWDLSDPDPFPVRLFPLKEGVAKMALSGDGQTLVTFSLDVADLGVRLWDLNSPEDPPVQLLGHGSSIEDIAISTDGMLLASASSDRTVRLWDLMEPRGLPARLSGFEQAIFSVALDPSGGLIASGGEGQTVHLTRRGTDFETVELRGHKGAINSVTFAPDGELLASASDDGTVRLWQVDAVLNNGVTVPEAVLGGHEESVRGVAFSPDGALLASASVDGTVRLWAVNEILNVGEQPSPVSVLDAEADPAWAVAFSPDGKTIASGHASSAVLIWDVGEALSSESAAPAKRLLGHASGVCSVAFSPDGETLASAGQDLNILLWYPGDYDEDPIPLTGHEDWVFSLAFSPDGMELASASWDQTIKLWDLSNLSDFDRSNDDYVPDEPTTLTGHTSVVRSLAYSSDGSTLASASEDKTIQLWQVDASTFIELACQQVRRNLSWEEWERNIPNAAYRLTCPNLPVHPSFLDSARDLAEKGDAIAAINRYQQAMALNPELELDPLAETAAGLVDGGMDEAVDGAITDALAYFERAQELSPDLVITADEWLTLCSAGVRAENATAVADACENAAGLAMRTDDIPLNRALCELAGNEMLIEMLGPACSRASELAAATDDAYLNYLICVLTQHPELVALVSASCERADGLIGQIVIGETITGVVQSGVSSLWKFEGSEGQVVTVSMAAADGSDLDAFLTIVGPDGHELVFNDDTDISSDSLIEDFALPQDGTYAIIAQGYKESEGPFLLSLSAGN